MVAAGSVTDGQKTVEHEDTRLEAALQRQGLSWRSFSVCGGIDIVLDGGAVPGPAPGTNIGSFDFLYAAEYQ
jgi:hypothetical protein